MKVAEWVAVGRAADIPPGHAARVEIDGVPVAIFNCNGDFYVLDDTCSHQEASLSEGDLDLDRCVIECPLHGGQFDLTTGKGLGAPITCDIETFPTRVVGDEVQVMLA